MHLISKQSSIISMKNYTSKKVLVGIVLLTFMIKSNFCELPTCVEVVEVVPSAFEYSGHLLKAVFMITFSKPVHNFHHYDGVIFITPSLTDVYKHYPRSIRSFGSSLKHYETTFSIDIYEYRVYRSIMLVINGGHFYIMEEHYLGKHRGRWQQYVPVSIFGPYHIENSSVIYRNYKPISPSPYCYKQPKRLFHRLTMNSIVTSINVTVSHNDNQLLEDGTLLLSLSVSSVGKATVKLPNVTTAMFNGHKVSVKIPNTTVYVHRRDTGYNVPISISIIHELMERMYHIPFYGTVPIVKSLPPRPPSTYLYSKFRRSEYKFGVKQNSSAIFFHTASGKQYVTYSTRMNMKVSGKLPHPPYTIRMQKCEANTPRAMDSGRMSPTYHSIELGPYYLLIVPNLYNLSKPTASDSITIKVNNIDVTNKITLHKNKESNDRLYSVVPDHLHNILDSYVFIAPALTNNKSQMVIAKDIIKNSVLVPKLFNENGNCYNVNLFLNHFNITDDKNFCEKHFGYCIGLPFASKSRFPDIPILHENNIKIDMYQRHLFIRNMQSLPLKVHNVNIQKAVILQPHFDPSSCDSIWNLKVSTTTNARLILSLTNKGQGGADLRVTVKCSLLLDLYPTTGIRTKWVGPGDTYVTDYQVDSLQVVGTDQNIHKCEMEITYPGPQTIACSRIIRTYGGLFQDPCTAKESTLPDYSLKYFILPSSQIQPSLLTLNSFLKSPVGSELVFMRAITVSLTLRIGQEHLISNLNMLRISCLEGVVMILEEDQLMNVIANSRLIDKEGEQKTTATAIIGSTLNYTSSLTLNRKIYFFATRSWVASVSTDSPSRVPSGCTVELFANRPVQQCVSNPVNLKTLIVPLVETEVKVLKEIVQEERWYLDVLYGSKISMEAMHTLVGCLFLSALMLSVTIISYMLLFIFRKKLPSKAYFKMLEDTLSKDMKKENKRWENPQMYLEKGSRGTYYTLFNFKCTHPISLLTQNILKEMKVAGLLRYKEKELQVLFGHVKKVFFNSKSGMILLQASSGMYLLKPENVHEEFKKELYMFYTKKKIAINKEGEL